MLIVSCEHGGFEIPPAYRPLFRNAESVLRSHRGWDIGALAVAKRLARLQKAPLHHSTVSRLVIDLNRSPRSKSLFSPYVRALGERERRRIFEEHYLPYRRRLEKRIEKAIAEGHRVLHVSVHSFTPVLYGETRRVEISVLYDPKHRLEKRFSDAWIKSLKRDFPEYRIRRNNPYRGDTDSFTRHLRRIHPKDRYMGIELEVNQAIAGGFDSARARREFSRRLSLTLSSAVAGADLA